MIEIESEYLYIVVNKKPWALIPHSTLEFSKTLSAEGMGIFGRCTLPAAVLVNEPVS